MSNKLLKEGLRFLLEQSYRLPHKSYNRPTMRIGPDQAPGGGGGPVVGGGSGNLMLPNRAQFDPGRTLGVSKGARTRAANMGLTKRQAGKVTRGLVAASVPVSVAAGYQGVVDSAAEGIPFLEPDDARFGLGKFGLGGRETQSKISRIGRNTFQDLSNQQKKAVLGDPTLRSLFKGTVAKQATKKGMEMARNIGSFVATGGTAAAAQRAAGAGGRSIEKISTLAADKARGNISDTFSKPRDIGSLSYSLSKLARNISREFDMDYDKTVDLTKKLGTDIGLPSKELELSSILAALSRPFSKEQLERQARNKERYGGYGDTWSLAKINSTFDGTRFRQVPNTKKTSVKTKTKKRI